MAYQKHQGAPINLGGDGWTVSPEKFREVYDFIMEDETPHTMMFVDLHKKANHPSMIRKNYTSFVTDV